MAKSVAELNQSNYPQIAIFCSAIAKASLFLKAGTRRIACLHSRRPVIRAHLAQGAIAPAMSMMGELTVLDREHLIRLFRNEKFLRAKVAAAIVRLHNQAMS
ncbi:MAG TPA: hypothetical protein VK327_09990 [Candidatus Paceibacterota bacterium]|nr:hypothetical protein [Candidatus Paceibacterota bacterium]